MKTRFRVVSTIICDRKGEVVKGTNMNKFKAWLWKTNDEGISNFDAITIIVTVAITFGGIILLAKL